MIVGVDHLGWGVTALAPAVDALVAIGYRERFRELGARNDISKRPYLREHRPSHDLVFLASADGSPSIELVRHGGRAAPRRPGALPTILVDAAPSDQALRAPLSIQDAVSQAWPGSDVALTALGNVPVLYANLGGGAKVAAYVVGATDLEAAVCFWTRILSFRRERSGLGWALLAFPSPVPVWRLRVLIARRPRPSSEVLHLDDEGVTNLALLTTDIESERRRIASFAGAEIADTFDITVNGKALRACVGRAPGGDMIELLEIHRIAPD